MSKMLLNELDILNYTEIIKEIKTKDFINADKNIKKLFSEFVNSPIPHNLYAILCETKKDFEHARCHYRVALALDPTYLPAIKNLDRVTRFFYSDSNIDYGNILLDKK